MDEPRPEPRIGDRERRETDSRLQQAMADGVLTLGEYDERAAQCWAARTRTDLDALTRDLPEPHPAEAAATTKEVARPASRPPDVGQRMISGAITVALVGAGLFLGGRVITADDGVAVFSSQTVQIGADQDDVDVGALFGRIEVRVPDDVRIRTTAGMIFGQVECNAACTGGANLREVVLDARGGFAHVEVLRQDELSDEQRDNLDDQQEDLRDQQQDRDDG